MACTIHVVGAGLAGLSAAVKLAEAGERVIVYEAAPHAGGRCRSYHDPALGMSIDNGNHLVLSGNRATLAYVRAIGSEIHLVGPPEASFPFVDLAADERWTVAFSNGRIPWWLFDPARRVPRTRVLDYLAFAALFLAPADSAIGEVVSCSGLVYDRLLRPLLLAALNTEPREAAAGLAAAVLRETLLIGGCACRPLIARDGLAAAFIDPALDFLRTHAATVRFGDRLREIGFGGDSVESLTIGDEVVRIPSGDAVILAVPPVVAGALVPQLQTPTEFRAIVNGHFRIAPGPDIAPIIGVINGTTEWIFAFRDRLSVTISAADRLLEVPREELAQTIWSEVAAVTGIGDTGSLPPWQIVRERRATFAALPGEVRKRPGTRTSWANLFLAGDWTATGLPATIEGAIRSGHRAATLARAMHRTGNDESPTD